MPLGISSGLFLHLAEEQAQQEREEGGFVNQYTLADDLDAQVADLRAQTTALRDQGWGGGTWEDVDNFFNTANTLFHTDQDAYRAWAQSDPEMAIRYHAQAAARPDAVGEGSWAGDWTQQDHESAAFGLAHLWRGEELGEDLKNDGRYLVPTYSYGSQVTPDISSDAYNNVKDFWRIGSLNSGLGGVSDFLDENPWVLPAAALSFWGAPAIASAAGGGVLGGAAGGAAAAGGTTLMQGGDIGDALQSGAVGGLLGGLGAWGSDALSGMSSAEYMDYIGAGEAAGVDWGAALGIQPSAWDSFMDVVNTYGGPVSDIGSAYAGYEQGIAANPLGLMGLIAAVSNDNVAGLLGGGSVGSGGGGDYRRPGERPTAQEPQRELLTFNPINPRQFGPEDRRPKPNVLDYFNEERPLSVTFAPTGRGLLV